MSKILKIYYHPFFTLSETAQPVSEVDDKIRSFLDDMVVTMKHFRGVGLAANQVGILKRCIVVDTDQVHSKGEVREDDKLDHDGKPICLVNPEIIEHSQETFDDVEACLSLPGIDVKATRYEWVRVRYTDYNNTQQEVKAYGLFGQCIQHEIDHLNGKTLLDFTSKMKRDILVKKMDKFIKHQSEDSNKLLDISDARIIHRNLL